MDKEKEVELGKYLYFTKESEHAKELLLEYYKSSKAKYELSTKEVWCVFYESEFIKKEANYNYDPFNQLNTLAIRWKVRGRAFYIKRSFEKSIALVERHKHKSNVPKRKRGKIKSYYG